VLTGRDADEAERACHALVAGGLAAVEVTFRTDVAAEAIRRVAETAGLLVGAGTVLSPEQLARALDAGARFALAPGTNDTPWSRPRERPASRSSPVSRRRPRSSMPARSGIAS
jgi:2-dehydro-3-deoxyphosphogluconate aldolase/(4S)-4-hydroxy-2-oxoglutarate aldolase